MGKIQLYIDGQRVDMFEDETIEVKSSIQDAKDISKVFTDFSKPFNLPASSPNNKIFKHFYNYNIKEGFDARVQVPAEIYIDFQLFRKGKIFLEGVEMKNKVPHTYKVIFFGNTVSLKDVFKDDTLHALNLSDFSHTFDYDTVRGIFKGNGFTANSDGPGYVVNGDNDSLIYPLITSKRRLFYDSDISDTSETNYEGNLYRSTNVNHNLKRGVSEADLKPAIKVYYIIKAIEDKYNINFIPNDTAGTKDFFSRHNDAISNLYLWISNNSGNITDRTDGDNYFYIAEPTSFSLDNSYSNVVDFSYFSVDSNGVFTVSSAYDLHQKYKGGNITRQRIRDFKIHVTPTAVYDEVNWRLKVLDADTGEAKFTKEGIGSEKFFIDIPADVFVDQKFKLQLQSEAAMEDTTIKFEARRVKTGADDFEVYTTGANIDTNSKEFVLTQHLPEIKIIDFIAGLINMFNLTAYYLDDETDSEYSSTKPVIKVVTLDNFYADAANNQSKGTIDITEYIDTSSHVVNTSLPFSEIKLKYKEHETLLRKNHLETYGKVWGDSDVILSDTYPGKLFFGEPYEVKVPFSILKYEHLKDHDGTDTDIQWGYAAGGDFDTVDADYTDTQNIIPPKGDYSSIDVKNVLFYGIKVTGAHTINIRNEVGTSSAGETTYFRPSNTNETATTNSDGDFETPATYQLTFGPEIDEFTGYNAGLRSNSLYAKFYRSYLTSVFNSNKRLFTYTAYLPPRVLSVLKLNDQLKIQDTIYRINSIVTSLRTGKSKLELINLDSDEIVGSVGFTGNIFIN